MRVLRLPLLSVHQGWYGNMGVCLYSSWYKQHQSAVLRVSPNFGRHPDIGESQSYVCFGSQPVSYPLCSSQINRLSYANFPWPSSPSCSSVVRLCASSLVEFLVSPFSTVWPAIPMTPPSHQTPPRHVWNIRLGPRLTFLQSACCPPIIWPLSACVPPPPPWTPILHPFPAPPHSAITSVANYGNLWQCPFCPPCRMTIRSLGLHSLLVTPHFQSTHCFYWTPLPYLRFCPPLMCHHRQEPCRWCYVSHMSTNITGPV